MKYLLVLAVVLIGVWLWRSGRQSDLEDRSRQKAPKRSKGEPGIMVACVHCGTHLPQSEAVHGPGGVYCSAEHRQLHESARS